MFREYTKIRGNIKKENQFTIRFYTLKFAEMNDGVVYYK